MPVLAVADEVDDHVLVKSLTVGEGQTGHPDTGLRVVAVHMEDRGLHHFRHVGRVDRTPGRCRCRGEAELVVDDHVHRAAGAVAGKAGQVERLGHDSLTGEGGVAVDQHGHARESVETVLCRGGGAIGGRGNPVLLRPRHALDNRVDRFEMRGVGRQGDGELLPRRAVEHPAGALVVLDVTRALHRLGVEVALELLEDLAVRLPDDVGQDVEATAVSHAHHDLGHA